MFLIHFEFIFVCGARKCSSFIFLHLAIQFSQHHLLKRLPFPHCIRLPPLSKIRCPKVHDIFWGNQNWKRHMYPNVHYSTIYNSQDMEATWMSINRWIDKQWYLYTTEYYSAIKRNTFESVLMRWAHQSSNEPIREFIQK